MCENLHLSKMFLHNLNNFKLKVAHNKHSLIFSYRAESKKSAKHSRHSKKSEAGFGTTNNKAGGNGGTTSGAEEVERILQEARKKYGKISSLKENVEANISIIKKIPTDFSQVCLLPYRFY